MRLQRAKNSTNRGYDLGLRENPPRGLSINAKRLPDIYTSNQWRPNNKKAASDEAAFSFYSLASQSEAIRLRRIAHSLQWSESKTHYASSPISLGNSSRDGAAAARSSRNFWSRSLASF